jgi:hypothetical protein
MYDSDVTGDLEREKEICQLWTQTYPRDSSARGLLGVVYATLGQREQAAVQFLEALRLLSVYAEPHVPITAGLSVRIVRENGRVLGAPRVLGS